MKRLLTAILCAGLSSVCLAGVYDVKFERVAGYEDENSCLDFVGDIASKFAAQSNAHVIDYGCKEDSFTRRGWDAVVTYQSPTPIVVTSTYTASVYPSAFYATRSSCNQQLSLQSELFKSATGLVPLAAYCMLDVGSRNWETRIDGLGQSVLSADSVGLRYSGALVDMHTMVASYRNAVQAYGLSIFDAGITGGFDGHIVLRLYSPEPYYISDYDDMKYASVASCTSAAEAVRAILGSAKKPVVAFCVKDRSREAATLHVTFFESLLRPLSVFEARMLTTRYTTMADCQRASGDIEGGSDEILGGVCAGSGTDYRVHLFNKGKAG